MTRPSWDEFYLQMAELMATRSTCLRHKQGAVIVGDKCVLSTGFNGVASGCTHCEELGRARAEYPSGQRLDLCRAVHAEQNALVKAAKHGISIKGATLYSTSFPCMHCASMIINGGIVRVVSREMYPDKRTEALLTGRVAFQIIKKE